MDNLQLTIQEQVNILFSHNHLLQTIFWPLLLKNKVQLKCHYVHVYAPFLHMQ